MLAGGAGRHPHNADRRMTLTGSHEEWVWRCSAMRRGSVRPGSSKLTRLYCSGLSALGAVTILAESGDLTRFATPRAVGQTRRPGAREKVPGTLHRPLQAHWPVQARPAVGRVAVGPGSPTRQPRLRRRLPAPDQPRAEQAHLHHQAQAVIAAGILASAARRGHHWPRMGYCHRHPRHQAARGAATA